MLHRCRVILLLYSETTAKFYQQLLPLFSTAIIFYCHYLHLPLSSYAIIFICHYLHLSLLTTTKFYKCQVLLLSVSTAVQFYYCQNLPVLGSTTVIIYYIFFSQDLLQGVWEIVFFFCLLLGPHDIFMK